VISTIFNPDMAAIYSVNSGASETLSLPIPGQRNILITSALPYVNNQPHLGNIIGCVLSGDVFARYCRLRGWNTIYLSGTDEYGTATEVKALVEGKSPKEICDQYHEVHREIYQMFNISFDIFGRTTTTEQTVIAQQIFLDLEHHDCFIEQETKQLYSEMSQIFLADRYIEGTCPKCSYVNAKGDQCDQCHQLLNPLELIDPICCIDGSRPILKKTKHLYLNFDKYRSRLEEWLKQSMERGQWSPCATSITKAWLERGLEPRCITRDLKWGTPVPLKKYEDKVFYVWFDAPIGYISIMAQVCREWRQWWQNPDQVELYQFMGKDNVAFHSIVFPYTLLATEANWTMVNHISATHYLQYGTQKFSKSRGIGIFGSDIASTLIPVDVWRFYLIMMRPENADTSFDWNDFQSKNNTELVNNIGNYINRVISFVTKQFDGILPEANLVTETEVIQSINTVLSTFHDNMNSLKLRDALRNCLSISSIGNKYWQLQQPWKLLKTNMEKCQTVILLCANIIKLLATMLEPFMPKTSDLILSQLQDQHILIPEQFNLLLSPGHKIGVATPLFQKITNEMIVEYEMKFGVACNNSQTD